MYVNKKHLLVKAIFLSKGYLKLFDKRILILDFEQVDSFFHTVRSISIHVISMSVLLLNYILNDCSNTNTTENFLSLEEMYTDLIICVH